MSAASAGYRQRKLSVAASGASSKRLTCSIIFNLAQNLRLAGAINKRFPAPFLQSRTVPVSRTVASLVADFGFDPIAQEPAAELSHGAKKALELTMVLATDSRVILLDEPTAG
jgi:ABC-type uncharacterized transport system ATPase subunit